MKIRIPAALALAAALAIGLATAASAAPGKVTAVTHVSGHNDTTSVSGPCTVSSPGGPVWAYDNLSLRFVVTPEQSPGNYSVTIHANGSFDGFSDPITGDCSSQRGSVDGWLQYDVQSSTAPDPAALPAQSDGALSQGTLLNRLFDGNATIVGGGAYDYVYNRIDGGRYEQVG